MEWLNGLSGQDTTECEIAQIPTEAFNVTCDVIYESADQINQSNKDSLLSKSVEKFPVKSVEKFPAKL